MITTYLRSSSIGAWDGCNHAGFLQYTLGFKTPSNIKAEKGNIVHKILECLAHKKKCEQDGINSFDDDMLGNVNVSDCEIVPLLDKIFEHTTKTVTHLCWTQKDYKDCKDWVNRALNHKNGMFDPRQANILMPEQRFDLVIPHSWASFDYKLPSGKEIKGQLSIKGTMDLIVSIDKNTIEVIDYKTGRRLDWNSGQTKDFKKLNQDKQLMLYYYAASLLYPDIDYIIVSIFYINDGGVFTLPFSKKDIPRIEQMIQSSFSDMKDCLVPRQNFTWKCEKLCHFGKNNYKDTNITICEHMHNEVLKKGIGVVTEEYGDGKSYLRYSDGGGRKDKD